jgi:hypothetical protein
VDLVSRQAAQKGNHGVRIWSPARPTLNPLLSLQPLPLPQSSRVWSREYGGLCGRLADLDRPLEACCPPLLTCCSPLVYRAIEYQRRWRGKEGRGYPGTRCIQLRDSLGEISGGSAKLGVDAIAVVVPHDLVVCCAFRSSSRGNISHDRSCSHRSARRRHRHCSSLRVNMEALPFPHGRRQ